MSGNLREAFRGMKEEPANVPRRPVLAPAPPLPLQRTGKSSHPEFEPVKVYLRKATRKEASRKWEDENGGDFSDLVQHLLAKYLGA